MTDTPRLGITQLEEDQALPEAVVNEAVRDLEGYANATHFKSRTTTAEPGSPADGDIYLVPASATGTNWAGQDGKIARFVNTAWKFDTAKEGFVAWVDDDDELVVFDGSDWIDPVPPSGAIEVQAEGVTETSNLVMLNFTGSGVSATDDGSGNVEVNIPGGGGGGGSDSGTSFPVTPSTNDRFFRTDRGIEYYYDGTRWLSMQQFRVAMGFGDNPTIPLTATKAATFRFDNPEGGVWSIYVESLHFGTYLTAGSTVWTIATTVLGVGTSLGSTTTTGDAATTPSNHIVTVNAVFASSVAAFQTDFTKTSGTGNIYPHGTMLYRLVG